MDIVEKICMVLGEEVSGTPLPNATVTGDVEKLVKPSNVIPTNRRKKKKKLVSGTVAMNSTMGDTYF